MEHAWVPIVHKGNPSMKCGVCGFIWQPHMRTPKVTCADILAKTYSPSNPRYIPKKPKLKRTPEYWANLKLKEDKSDG